MNFTPQQIETITRSVLRELASRGVSVPVPATTLKSSPKASALVAATGGETVGVNEKVISEEILVTDNAAGKSINIPAGAIITPSGHDYIRRNGITVTSVLSTNTAGQPTADGAIILIGASFTATAAANTAKWAIVAAGCERDAARKVRKQISKPVVCCGGEPSVTACLLNRDSQLRVAVVNQNTDVGRLARLMNPQVICLDTAGWSSAQLLKVLKAMTLGKAAPTSWKELT